MGNSKSKHARPNHELQYRDSPTGKLNLKIVFVGDTDVGKTCLLISYAEKEFPTDYVPSVFEVYEAPILVGGEEAVVHYWDTHGNEAGRCPLTRRLSYPNTGIVVLCFSVVNHSSFTNIADRWCTEVNHHLPNTKLVLLGMKTDLRKDLKTLEDLQKDDKVPLSRNDGEEMARSIHAACYLECSALTGEGVVDVFDNLLYEGGGDILKNSHVKSARK